MAVSKKVRKMVLESMERDLKWVKDHPFETGPLEVPELTGGRYSTAQKVIMDESSQLDQLIQATAVDRCERRIRNYKEHGVITHKKVKGKIGSVLPA